jgi:hypothetical protein
MNWKNLTTYALTTRLRRRGSLARASAECQETVPFEQAVRELDAKENQT